LFWVNITYLGDFGAASFYTTHHELYEKIEVRAFGCLIDDLLKLCSDKESVEFKALRKVADCTMQEESVKRPAFHEIIL